MAACAKCMADRVVVALNLREDRARLDGDDAVSLLEGVLVLDVASYIAGPAATTVLADFGADVIKIEPLEGDPYRLLGRNAGPHNPFWVQDARNKRSLAIDLKHAQGRAVFAQLVQRADVLVTNYRDAVLERLQMRWEDLQPINARLIYASLTGFGRDGPDADQSGFDVTAWWARSGLMDFVRRSGGLPTGSAPGMGDHATAMSMVAAIMMGLYRRDRTGTGSHVTTSLLANGVWAHAMMTSVALCGMPVGSKDVPVQPGNAVSFSYETRDGRWLHVNMMNEPKEWDGLLAALDLQALADDARFARIPERRTNAPALAAILASRFRALDRSDVEQRLRVHGVTHGFAMQLHEVDRDVQLKAADVLTPVAEQRDGLTHLVNSPIWIEGLDKMPPRYAPRIGEHSRSILGELGYQAAAIESMIADGIVREPVAGELN